MDLGDLRDRTGTWLAGVGPESDIVVSTRIRLARNLAGYRFPGHAAEDERAEVEQVISTALHSAATTRGEEPLRYVSLESESAVDRQLLVERRLISKEHAHARGPRGVAFDLAESESVMINEEDHLRLQTLASGLALEEVWERCRTLDDRLSERLRFAFSPELGYLTSCPTNVGTGIRVSVMVHLPALAMIDHVERIKAAANQLGLAVRGLYGEGSRAHGDFYQLSNQITLGRTEEALIEQVATMVPQILAYERKARAELLARRRGVLEDRVWRCYGTLSQARRISSEETLDCLSSLRLGAELGLVDDVTKETISELLLFTQPAHLQKIEGATLDPQGRDIARASAIRRVLGARQ